MKPYGIVLISLVSFSLFSDHSHAEKLSPLNRINHLRRGFFFEKYKRGEADVARAALLKQHPVNSPVDDFIATLERAGATIQYKTDENYRYVNENAPKGLVYESHLTDYGPQYKAVYETLIEQGILVNKPYLELSENKRFLRGIAVEDWKERLAALTFEDPSVDRAVINRVLYESFDRIGKYGTEYFGARYYYCEYYLILLCHKWSGGFAYRKNGELISFSVGERVY